MIDFILTKDDKGFDLSYLMKLLYSLNKGEYKVTIKKKRANRTNPQNNYLWGVVYEYVLRGLIDIGYDDITNIDQVHELCKLRFTKTEVVNKHTGEIIYCPIQSTKTMDKVEFSTYVDLIKEWAKEYLNIDIPEPNN